MAAKQTIDFVVGQTLILSIVEKVDSNRVKSHDKFAVYVIFFYWMIYENVLFFYAGEIGFWLLAITNLLKFIVPIGLLSYTGINAGLFRLVNIFYYLLYFTLFIIWIGLVTAFNGDLVEWYKLIPRYIFFLAVLSLFYKVPASVYLFIKIMIAYVTFSLFQYIVTYATGAWSSPVNYFGYDSTGVLGLYSNITSMMHFPQSSVPIIRLTGFWNEPSNASGSAFASFFLANFLYKKGHGAIWKYTAYACLISGILCFSNAGYFGFGMALFVGIFAVSNKDWKLIKLIYVAIVSTVSIFALWLTFFGRSFVRSSSSEENFILRAIVGLRESDDTDDVYGGRFDLMINTLSYVQDNLFGQGLKALDVSNNVMTSASAIIYWLLIGGVVGVLLLIFRELALIRASYRLVKIDMDNIYLVQALAAVMAQHLSYGSWMNPNYLVLAAAILAFSHTEKKRILIGCPRLDQK